MGFFTRGIPTGRASRPFFLAERHTVLGTPLEFPQGTPPGTETIYFGMGCFWGSEELFWQIPGVYSTAVGYQGGTIPNPTYEEVCGGSTGHAEIVQVVYDPAEVPLVELLAVFWENHDPTQGDRQGNDIGSQYRSAIFYTNPQQEAVVRATADQFSLVLQERGLGPITTEIRSAAGLPFYYAEDYHQQYLDKIPNGYRCHSSTGVTLPR